jgi:hypothetical protein
VSSGCARAGISGGRTQLHLTFHGFLVSTGNGTRVVGRFQLHPLVFAAILSTFVSAVVVAAVVAEQAIYVQSE